MKRSHLKRFAEQVAQDLAGKGYEYWYAHARDETVLDHEIEGQHVQVEVQVLECNADFVQLGVSVSDSGLWSSYFPPGTTVVVKRDCLKT